ncbi:LysE family translocator [Aquimarina hainanensis]|uniref:LysE family translocator n=1 Tax=Aquimarina hainanensis TaxID=1578017 RepID=A0ABW5N508_9FLAO|nr:LysE family transporter [Aquimarina sp. TRL1]QKX04681.1 LysE family transporter [Aquimarina sp. TRL1]
MLQDIQAAIPLGFFLAFLIGPVFFVLLETAAIKGVKAAISFDLGVILADIVFIAIAYLTSFQLLENLSNQPGLYVFGGMILVVYGLITYLKKPSREALDPNRLKVKKNNYLSLFVKGFLLNFINIGVLVFWLGLIIIVGPTLDNDPNRLFLFFGVTIGVYFATDLLKIILAKQLKRKLTPRRIFKIKKLLGFILILCGIIMTVKGFLPKDKLDIQKGIEKINTERIK